MYILTIYFLGRRRVYFCALPFLTFTSISQLRVLK